MVVASPEMRDRRAERTGGEGSTIYNNNNIYTINNIILSTLVLSSYNVLMWLCWVMIGDCAW